MDLFHPLSFQQSVSLLRELLPERWTRHVTLLGPLQVVVSLVFMNVLGTKGYRRVMNELATRLGDPFGWLPTGIPSTPAFTQARKKVSEESVFGLFRQLIARCPTANRRPKLSYGRLRLVCCDGSNVVLPSSPALMNHFGSPSNQVGASPTPQAGLVLLWDAGRSMPLDVRIVACKPNEREGLIEMLPTLEHDDLLLADRGFPSRVLVCALEQHQRHYLMRVPRSSFAVVDAFFASERLDDIVEIAPTAEHAAAFGDRPLRVRLIKRPALRDEKGHKLADGQDSVYATSLLDPVAHPREQLIAVYGKRWCIETGLHEMKVLHGLEKMHARTVHGVKQEIVALMIFLVLCAELDAMARETYADQFPPEACPPPVAARSPTPPIAPAAPESEPLKLVTYPVHFNRVQMAEFATNLLGYCIAGNRDMLFKVFDFAIAQIWQYRTKPRPGRSFPRVPKSPNAKQKHVRRAKAKLEKNA